MISPQEFFQAVNAFTDIRPNSETEKCLIEFIQHSTVIELEQALLLCLRLTTNYNARWVDQARVSLNIRIAEQAAESASKLIQYTEQLTKQAETNIQHSKKLTEQTEKLLGESINLSRLTRVLIWLTVALGLFAIIQIVLMVFDI
jgi:hypothetical protein